MKRARSGRCQKEQLRSLPSGSTQPDDGAVACSHRCAQSSTHPACPQEEHRLHLPPLFNSANSAAPHRFCKFLLLLIQAICVFSGSLSWLSFKSTFTEDRASCPLVCLHLYPHLVILHVVQWPETPAGTGQRLRGQRVARSSSRQLCLAATAHETKRFQCYWCKIPQ